MIITQEKPIEEIMQFLAEHKKILVLGCDGCTQPPRSLREANVQSMLIEISGKLKNKGIECKVLTVSKQCDNNVLKTNLADKLNGITAIVSMACGIGPQTLVEVFPNMEVYPGQNTMFIGSENSELAIFLEKCQSCGNCVLAKTGGICPIARCSKSLLNGPCGGSQNGKCEVSKEMDCGWQLICDRMKLLGRLELLDEIFPAKDWRTSRDGGVRKIVREDLKIAEDTKIEVKKEQIIGKY